MTLPSYASTAYRPSHPQAVPPEADVLSHLSDMQPGSPFPEDPHTCMSRNPHHDHKQALPFYTTPRFPDNISQAQTHREPVPAFFQMSLLPDSMFP